MCHTLQDGLPLPPAELIWPRMSQWRGWHTLGSSNGKPGQLMPDELMENWCRLSF